MPRDDLSRAEAAVMEAAERSGLLAPGRPILVLLSGGRDSVCLLDVAVRLAGVGAVGVLHVNYGLREAATEDERHCADLCVTLGVALTVERARPPDDGNLQAWARDVRYGRAAALTLGGGALVATGHTATDQVETVLYRLAASPGRRALLGMSPRDGRLARPLLEVSRDQTGAYCLARGLSWRDDESNASDRFARGRVRAGLLPALRAIHPAAEANVIQTARLLRDEAAVLEAAVDDVLAGAAEIEVARLAALNPALARLVVRRLAEDAAGRSAAVVTSRLEDLLALAGRPGRAALDVGAGLRAHVEHGVLRFSPLVRAEGTPRQVVWPLADDPA